MAAALMGKQALVTGASAGIGRACAMALAKAGARVIATGRREAELASLKNQCPVETVAGDLNDPAFSRDLAARARDVELFVNNAGVLTYAPVLEMTDEQVESMFRTNVLAAFRITRDIARAMAEKRRGHIIIMSSIAAREVYPLTAIYAATKHALAAITRGLRIELQGQGVKVTEIAPGMVDTGIRDTSTHPRVQEGFKARKFSPLTPEEVAEAVVFATCATPNLCPDFIELRPRGSAT
jgi:NADP-dependent 3-hydroxy acid dehydrogenase YdfG